MVVQESTHPRSPLSVDRGVIRRQLPMLRTAAGRCYLAHCRAAERDQIIKRLEAADETEDRPYLTASWLDQMINEVRDRGYASRFHESYNSYTSSIAVPVFSDTALMGSIAVIWLTKALTLAEGVDQFFDAMREATQRITIRHDRMHADR
jgi:IclR family mhp operon transcriptional activator